MKVGGLILCSIACFNLTVIFDMLKFTFLDSCKNTLDKCGDLNMFENIFNFDNFTFNSFSVRNIDTHVADSYKTEWVNNINQKSSLKDYSKLKFTPSLEKYLLDKTNFLGASLKFKLRSNTLPLDGRTCKWSKEISGHCTLCQSGEIEDIRHFLFNCTSLSIVREAELSNLKHELDLCDESATWDKFTNCNIDDKIHFVLGGEDNNYSEDVLSLFDKYCKQFVKLAWDLRSNLKIS